MLLFAALGVFSGMHFAYSGVICGMARTEFNVPSPEDLLPLLVRLSATEKFVIDVGANVGQTTIPLIEAGAHVLAFEPRPRSCARFVRSIYNVHASKVDFVCAAVGSAVGVLNFEEAAASTSFAVSTSSRNRFLTVPVVTLESVLLARGIKRVDILKTDTQGYEFQVLVGAGGFLSTIPEIILEFSYGLLKRAGTDPIQFLAWLESQNLVCFYMEKRERSGPVPWPIKSGYCPTFSEFSSALQGGWTNLWCRHLLD
jgi:FkbM family methyltransferase